MKAGLTNLETLKRHLLAGQLSTSAQFDGTLAAIGAGVGEMFEKACNRGLEFQAGAQFMTSAVREHVVLPRYPVVEISSVEVRWAGESAWTVIEGEPSSVSEESGLVFFSGALGGFQDRVRVTYTGGFWFETLDPNDDGYPSAKPAGATELPGDLQLAFLTQCEQVWQTHDRLGTGIVGGDGGQFLNTRLSTLELVPMVKEILRGYTRYQMS